MTGTISPGDQATVTVALAVEPARAFQLFTDPDSVADRVAAVPRLNAFEFAGGVIDCLVPRYFAPRFVDTVANHRRFDAVGMRGITPGKTSLHAGVAVIGEAVFIRHHAHNLRAFHFGLE